MGAGPARPALCQRVGRGAGLCGGTGMVRESRRPRQRVGADSTGVVVVNAKRVHLVVWSILLVSLHEPEKPESLHWARRTTRIIKSPYTLAYFSTLEMLAGSAGLRGFAYYRRLC